MYVASMHISVENIYRWWADYCCSVSGYIPVVYCVRHVCIDPYHQIQLSFIVGLVIPSVLGVGLHLSGRAGGRLLAACL